MPNWCLNNVTLSHDDPAMLDRAQKALEVDKFFNEFIPMPAEESENWYSWNTTNWGTKWEASVSSDSIERDGNSISASFDTAWSPPVEAYRQLTDLGFEIRATYYEPGMGFVGEYTSEDDDDYYDISGDSDWVEENIPMHLNEEYGIAEGMRDWEAEQDEEEEDENLEEPSEED